MCSFKFSPEPTPLRDLRDAADHAPDERALPLPVGPGMEVVGDECEGEAGFLGLARVANEVIREVLLGREGVAELGHGASRTSRAVRKTPFLRRRTGKFERVGLG